MIASFSILATILDFITINFISVGFEELSIGTNALSIRSMKNTMLRSIKELNECKMNNLELKSRVLKLELAIGMNI